MHLDLRFREYNIIYFGVTFTPNVTAPQISLLSQKTYAVRSLIMRTGRRITGLRAVSYHAKTFENLISFVRLDVKIQGKVCCRFNASKKEH